MKTENENWQVPVVCNIRVSKLNKIMSFEEQKKYKTNSFSTLIS